MFVASALGGILNHFAVKLVIQLLEGRGVWQRIVRPDSPRRRELDSRSLFIGFRWCVLASTGC